MLIKIIFVKFYMKTLIKNKHALLYYSIGRVGPFTLYSIR